LKKIMMTETRGVVSLIAALPELKDDHTWPSGEVRGVAAPAAVQTVLAET
jgi:hypothetical protein